ncbi:hypothetical protein B7P43_G04593 [Cryptotermes secundus]|uniref:Osiris 2 n=1 Tax=Cryptotermes secundus TaxID=105785 RepID=A0A2J7PI35_9NEOP|nr:uncharacterized protein LOC111873816 [Cryptotermes secundus]PNF15984.1 hypothetical protein B7P43_G04593 [Cryptotermes secundus]
MQKQRNTIIMGSCFVMGLLLVCIVVSVTAEESADQGSSTTTTVPQIKLEEAEANSSIKAVDITAFVTSRNGTSEERGVRKGKDLLDWIGFGTGSDTDPYLARTNAACLNGDLSECFKSRALTSLDEFFGKDTYTLTDNAKVVRMPVSQLRQLHQEAFEFSSTPRAEEPEWDQFVKFLLRKVERFLKSTAIEVQFPNEVTEGGRYAPRFIDEIATEIDIIEDKNESSFSRTKLKKLFIPLLIILKLFKLKLLLFLPLILGLASFKKLLGFLAFVIPGLIGFFKLCKPDLHHNYGSYGHSTFYHQPPHNKHQYTAAGVATGHHYFSAPGGPGSYYGNIYARDSESQPAAAQDETYVSSAIASPSVAFRDQDSEPTYNAQQLAYRGYQHFQKG